MFSGSYRAEDVTFLLKRLPMADFVNVADKERLIQSGQRHYSEMLSPESLPSAHYLALFEQAESANRQQMAQDCLRLAALIHARRRTGITLVSLARAGTPVGVILKHILSRVFGRDAVHFSVSIVRDRGIDAVALRHILALGHTPESIVFVDGWTGKGVISRELTSAVTAFNAAHDVVIDPGLFVLSDLAGSAACSASCADYLIPSSILNATVSGLVSRSILNEQIGPDDFHGCVYYESFEAEDLSRDFADRIIAAAQQMAAQRGLPAAIPGDRVAAAQTSQRFMQQCMQAYGITDPNLIKPGIGEATRVLLRRMAERVIVRDPAAPAVAHLIALAAEKNVLIEHDPALPYQAVSLIRSERDVE